MADWRVINFMKLLILLALLEILRLTAHAAKTVSTVTPGNLEAHGFSVRLENQTDGTVTFTVIRDLTKASQFAPGSGLQISRYATLRVSDKTGLRAQCDVAPDIRHRGVINYRFTIARDCIAQSSFVLAEDHDYQDQTQEHLIGGGTHYSFALAPFAKHQTPKE